MGASPPGNLKGSQKKKDEKGKERERTERKIKGKKAKKEKKEREKDKSTCRIGRNSSTSRGAPEGLQGIKLQGCQIDGGGGGSAIL